MTQKTIISRLTEDIPFICNVNSDSEYAISIPENLALMHSKLYANAANLSNSKDIESVNVSHYKHNRNTVFNITVIQSECEPDDSDSWDF